MYVERINLLCALTGKKVSDISKDLGYSRNRIYNYLNGHREFDKIVQLAICNYFKVPEKVFTQHTLHLVLRKNKLEIL